MSVLLLESKEVAVVHNEVIWSRDAGRAHLLGCGLGNPTGHLFAPQVQTSSDKRLLIVVFPF